MISPKSNRITPIKCDFHIYRSRHLVENFFCKLKQFRGIATNVEKIGESDKAMINLAATVLTMR